MVSIQTLNSVLSSNDTMEWMLWVEKERRPQRVTQVEGR